MSRSTTYLGPQARLNRLSIEKKAWFMFKILCQDLSGATFAQIRDILDNRSGLKTRVKLSQKGWRVGSKLTLNPKVQYEFYPFNVIDRILQDVHFVNVLLVILFVDTQNSDIQCRYEIIAYKFKNQSSAFRFQDVFNKLAGTGYNMARTMSRTELSLGSLALVPARSYHMGPLAVDRWGGPQAPQSEASYGRKTQHTRHFQNGKQIRSSLMPSAVVHDDPSDFGSLDSSDNATTTYREVAVSANIPVQDKQTEFFDRGNIWQPNGEVSAVVHPHNQNFNGSSILSDDSRFAGSSIDDSGFYGGPEVAMAHVHGPRTNEGIDVVDGTVSVRKIFSKQTRNGSSKGVNGSNVSSSAGDQYYQYRDVQVLSPPGMIGKKSRSIDHLGPSSVTYQTRPYHFQQQVQLPVSRGPSRSNLLLDNASVASHGSMYLLNPKFKKTYMSRNDRMDAESAYSHKLIGQY